MDLLDASLGDIAARLRELLDIDRATAAVNSGAAGSGDALLEAAHDWEAIGRAGDAARTWVAAEIAHESRRELDAAGLAYRHGFSTARKLLAATTNTSERTAAARISLGQRVRSSMSVTGVPNPSFFPVVESAFFAGRIGVDTAAVICRTLSEVVARTRWTEATDQAERHLVAAAIATTAGSAIDPRTDGDPDHDCDAEPDHNCDADPDHDCDAHPDHDCDAHPDHDCDADPNHDYDADGCVRGGAGGFSRVPRSYTVEEIARLACRIREHLDPDGAEPRDAVKQSLRGFSYPKVGADGMARGRYALPPYQLGVFLTAIDSILSPRTPDPAEPGPDVPSPNDGSDTEGSRRAADDHPVIDARTAEQKLLDAVITLVELAAASPAASRLNGAAPTVNVHVTLDDLQTGHGAGWIDGSTEPIPISTIRQLQCDGDTITTLFGHHGEVLQHGKTRRLATRRQRRALAARDGGCVIPGCTVPPSRCQAHHVTPWVSENYLPGRTDLNNLALLCPFHHSTIHTSAWQLVMIHGRPHVTPPGWHNSHRTARPASKQRTGKPW
jgi:hypothetical protein